MKYGLLAARITAYLLLITLQLTLAGCQKSDPEEAIGAALSELENHIEAGQTGKIMARLDDTIELSRRGQVMTRQEIRRLLTGLFLRYRKRQLTLAGVRIELDPLTGNDARVRFTALAWGGRQALPEDARHFQVDSHWHRDGDWRIQQLEIQ